MQTTMTPARQRLRSAWNAAKPGQRATELRADPSLLRMWELWARDDQLTPPGDWTYWLILAGRGWGKTRTGAEWVRSEVKRSRFVNLIGATADDARDIMIEGESGILSICPRGERPEYKPSQRKLAWPNGAVSLIFTADEPERLRGKQHEKLWADELAAWRYAEAWTQAQFGLRLGARPQACITTTPRPTPLVRELIADPGTLATLGTTYDNRDNLAPSFFSKIVKTYEGTRLGRQELNGEVLLDNPRALWTRARIDELRRPKPADDALAAFLASLRRIVVAIDPAVTSNEHSDETGIVVAGIGRDESLYVLEDCSTVATPDAWARVAVQAYRRWGADRIIAETNNGGDMVEAVIRSVDRSVSYRKVTATRGKVIRAEPIAALYEQGRAHHVGGFDRLEDQMIEFDPTIAQTKSPDRMDALVWAGTELFGGVSRVGSVSELRL
jgi:phage terminase large subunit-like protein